MVKLNERNENESNIFFSPRLVRFGKSNDESVETYTLIHSSLGY